MKLDTKLGINMMAAWTCPCQGTCFACTGCSLGCTGSNSKNGWYY